MGPVWKHACYTTAIGLDDAKNVTCLVVGASPSISFGLHGKLGFKWWIHEWDSKTIFLLLPPLRKDDVGTQPWGWIVVHWIFKVLIIIVFCRMLEKSYVVHIVKLCFFGSCCHSISMQYVLINDCISLFVMSVTSCSGDVTMDPKLIRVSLTFYPGVN